MMSRESIKALVLAVTVTNSIFAAEFISKLEPDSSEAEIDLGIDVVTESTSPSSRGCNLSEESSEKIGGDPSVVVPRSPANERSTIFAKGPLLLPMSMSNDLRVSLDRSAGERPGVDNLRFSVSSSGANGFQIIEPTAPPGHRARHEDIGKSVLSHSPMPQIQLVDNTLKLMAIKNSVDDVVLRVLPDAHGVQHTIENHI